MEGGGGKGGADADVSGGKGGACAVYACAEDEVADVQGVCGSDGRGVNVVTDDNVAGASCEIIASFVSLYCVIATT